MNEQTADQEDKPRLTELLAACRELGPVATPSLEDVLEDCGRTRLAACYMQAAAFTGLLGDDIVLTDQDTWPPDVLAVMERLHLTAQTPLTWRGLLVPLDDTQRQMLVAKVKGYVFEQHVVDSLNNGALGPLPFGADQAQLASLTNQPGWDIEFLKGSSVVGHYQVKATDYWQVLAHHWASYPSIPDVIATSEIADAATSQHLPPSAHVVDGGMSNADLTGHVQGALDSTTVLHSVHEVLPLWSLAAIMTLSAGQLFLTGRDRAEVGREAMHHAKETGWASGARLTTLLATHNPPAAAVAGIGTRIVRIRLKSAGHFADVFETAAADLRRVREDIVSEAAGLEVSQARLSPNQR